MKTINELRIIVEQELLSIKYPESPSDLYAPIDYILALGGKRMRPILLLLAHQLYKDDLEKAILPAVAIEVFHNFTLLHDDIMDNAPIRRTKATVHEKWNSNVAILSGDAMLIQSYQYLSGLEPEVLKSVLAIFNKMAIEVCEGQQYDMDFEIQAEVGIESYLKMIEFKTAVLLASSLQIGALIGGANSNEAEQLYLFGRDLGIAFQLKDDLLDVFSDQLKFGKQSGGDIIANKKTFLYLQAIAQADGNIKMELVNLYTSEDVNPTEKIERVKDIYSSLNIESSTLEMIDKYYKKAMRSLSKVKGDKSQLEAFAAMLKVRES